MANESNRKRFDESQGGGSGAERRGARVSRGACPKAQGAEVAVRPLQDHPSLRGGAPEQGDRGACRRARAHGRQVAPAVRRDARRGPLGRIPVRPAAHRDGRQGGGGGRADADHDAEGRDALVGPEHGRRDGRVAHDRAPDLVGVQPEAAPERDVQAVGEPAVRRQGAGHRGALHGPAGPRGRPVRRREVADPGVGPDAAGPADGAGGGRAENPRLCPPRHDDAFRRARHRPPGR